MKSLSSVQRRILTEAKIEPYRAHALGFAYAALEPHIDTETMKEHYSKHYMNYLDKLNNAMGSISKKERETVQKLLENFKKLPSNLSKEKKEDIKFNAGGVDNHNIFWRNIDPNNHPTRVPHFLNERIGSRFGSLDGFKKKFKEQALGIKGAGWVWLVEKNDNFEIITTANQDSPRLLGFNPILGLDIWEHSFYLKHKSDKESYINSLLKIINWNSVAQFWNK